MQFSSFHLQLKKEMQYILGEQNSPNTSDLGALAKERWTSLLPKLNKQLKLEAANNSRLATAMKSVGFSESDEKRESKHFISIFSYLYKPT